MVGMECKLCLKKFSNGKALGGHMRSHYATLPLPPKTPQRLELNEPPTESTSSLFSFSEEDNEKESGADKPLIAISCGLRENREKSLRLADPKLFGVGSVVVGRESESVSTRGRSKKAKGMSFKDYEVVKKGFLQKPSSAESLAELEMVNGSVLDGSFTKEDVALCLIMLSRDVWGWGDGSIDLKMSQQTRKVYKFERCDKVLKSSQGLGSHRTSHYKKMSSIDDQVHENEFRKPKLVEGQMHESPFVEKSLGPQALGGHKRSHILVSKFGESLVAINVSETPQDAAIDLNMPAAMENL